MGNQGAFPNKKQTEDSCSHAFSSFKCDGLTYKCDGCGVFIGGLCNIGKRFAAGTPAYCSTHRPTGSNIICHVYICVLGLQSTVRYGDAKEKRSMKF